MTQAGIVVSQFFNSFAVRTEEQSILRVGVFSNKPLVLAGLFGIFFVACISYVPALQSIFNTAPLSAIDWGVLIAFGALLLIAEETRKALLRSRRRRSRDGRNPRAGPPAGTPTPLAAKEESCTS
jgi:magnesium-transporting ATPase (P-type)